MLILQKGINWNDQPDGYKRGRMIVKHQVEFPVGVFRNKWHVEFPPIFTKKREYLRSMIPDIGFFEESEIEEVETFEEASH